MESNPYTLVNNNDLTSENRLTILTLRKEEWSNWGYLGLWGILWEALRGKNIFQVSVNITNLASKTTQIKYTVVSLECQVEVEASLWDQLLVGSWKFRLSLLRVMCFQKRKHVFVSLLFSSKISQCSLFWSKWKNGEGKDGYKDEINSSLFCIKYSFIAPLVFLLQRRM